MIETNLSHHYYIGFKLMLNCIIIIITQTFSSIIINCYNVNLNKKEFQSFLTFTLKLSS